MIEALRPALNEDTDCLLFADIGQVWPKPGPGSFRPGASRFRSPLLRATPVRSSGRCSPPVPGGSGVGPLGPMNVVDDH